MLSVTEKLASTHTQFVVISDQKFTQSLFLDTYT